MFGFTTDESILAGVPTITGHLDFIVGNIKANNPNAKIGVYETIPPNSSQDAFGIAYANG